VNQKLEVSYFQDTHFYGNELSKEKNIERNKVKTEAEINKLEQKFKSLDKQYSKNRGKSSFYLVAVC